ncbi:hypothetical protein C5167_049427 [Papaver somniferum]|uniref:Growth-regulating factor n=1 Tax=Papaver somniferum TaxID=3469 RepID=A0A4Y7KM80_PAPSO|nr:hypothetical protein C5167_049427 [Papaver somniferum]
MNNSSVAVATAVTTDTVNVFRPPFTASQWQELEHQALIFKYLMAGLPVPPELVLPIKKSFESMSARFFHHPTMGYCSFYGKKADPEPGRCRRTDGKKWRCSKDAYPDSKYCERHMHRGRNRSRKPVETQSISQSSTVTSLTASTGNNGGNTVSCVGSVVGGGGISGNGSFQNLPLMGNHQVLCSGNNSISSNNNNPSLLQMDSVPYGIPSKDYRDAAVFAAVEHYVWKSRFWTCDFSCKKGNGRFLLQIISIDKSFWSLDFCLDSENPSVRLCAFAIVLISSQGVLDPPMMLDGRGDGLIGYQLLREEVH